VPPKRTDDGTVAPIQLRRLEQAEATFDVRGLTPLIPHRWSEKAKRMMREKQTSPGGVRARKEAKDPDQDAMDSCYWLPPLEGSENARPGMPATAFKAAMVGACRLFEGISMTQAKSLFYVVGEGDEQLVPIEGEARVREDTPRNQTGVADLRYRMQFYPWSTTLVVRFTKVAIDADSIAALLDAGGRGGVGDWRPSSPKSHTGTFGQFEVVS
jgi:hypothetical protein